MPGASLTNLVTHLTILVSKIRDIRFKLLQCLTSRAQRLYCVLARCNPTHVMDKSRLLELEILDFKNPLLLSPL
ncbi:MAG: hypothetical protein A2Z97_16570 [Bdellovibrionales bacterium GWB1_52_6]|nr:MAG: hypothetical protein A2Z97_16570 [Bdellovibrionales bacterium GWB1_52_6]